MTILRAYAKDYQLAKEATKRNEKRKPKILAMVQATSDNTIEEPFGIFKEVPGNAYEYSSKVQDLEAKLADMKKAEREDGTAKLIENPFFRFSAK